MKIIKILIALLFLLSPVCGFSQVLLEADGVPNNTYELINSVLAPPNYPAEETPDQFDPTFGRHIAEVWDADLGKNVFEFYVHVSVPNELQDEATGDTDRQRCEIKTYGSSPANLLGFTGDSVVYKWRFRLPVGFQPSPNFTHIHQVKAVDGDDSNPIFTLTARYNSKGNKLELNYYDATTPTNVSTKLANVDLSLFVGNWVEATEKIRVDATKGIYSISIINVSTGANILTYSGKNLSTIRPTNSFIRPKWGVYRNITSLSYLRDEAVRFNSFSVSKITTTAIDNHLANNENNFSVFSNSSSKSIQVQYYLPEKETVGIDIFSVSGQKIRTLIQNENQENGNYKQQIEVSDLKSGIYLIRLQTSKSAKTIKFIF